MSIGKLVCTNKKYPNRTWLIDVTDRSFIEVGLLAVKLSYDGWNSEIHNDLMLTDSINDRGFKKMTFDDVYNVKCSLQKSSLASEECIWFGVEDVNPRIFVPDMHSPFEGAKKAIPYNLPSEVIISNRMHLNREQVKMLLPALQEFVDTGEI